MNFRVAVGDDQCSSIINVLPSDGGRTPAYPVALGGHDVHVLEVMHPWWC